MKTAPADKFRLGFIGAGKLAGSVIRGLVRTKFCAPALMEQEGIAGSLSSAVVAAARRGREMAQENL